MEKDAVNQRKQELEEFSDDVLRNRDKKIAQNIKYKIKAEDTKKMFQKIKRCRGQVHSGLSSIKIPGEDIEEWITIDTPTEIEEKL